MKRPVTHVHIGIEKTGTTSIQHFLARNRDLLLERDVLFPRSPGRVNHLQLSAYAQPDDAMDDTRSRYVSSVDELPRFRASLRERLRDEVAAAGPGLRSVVLSNEHLSARLRTSRDVARISDLVEACIGGDVRVVVYLREQTTNMRSSYSTNLRHGRQHPPASQLSEINLDKYDYARRLEPWLDVLGEERVTVRVFDPAEFVNGDLLQDFVDAIGQPWPTAAEVPSRKNEKFDAASMEFLRTFNGVVDEIVDDGDRAVRLRRELVQVLASVSDGPPLALDEQLVHDLREHVAPINRSVAQRFFGRDQLFRENDRASSGVPWEPLTTEELMRVFVRVWAAASEDDA